MASAGRDRVFILTIAVLFVGSGVCQIDHLRGANLRLKCDVPGNVDSITWKHVNDKIVEWTKEEAKTEWFKSQGFSGVLDTTNGDVQLFNLSKGGKFTCEILDGITVKLKSKEVVIWDQPPKPIVTCERNDTEITLHCSVNTKAGETVKWSGPNGLTGTDETLVVTEKLDKTAVFFCTAVNPATKTGAEFTLQDCKESSKVVHNNVAGKVVGAFIGIGLVIGLIVTGFVFRKRLVHFFRPDDRQEDARGQESQELNANNKQTTDLGKQCDK